MEQFDKTVKMTRIGSKELKSIPIICPWCNKIYNINEWEVEDDERIGPSHGICQKCFDKNMEEIKTSYRD